MSFLKIAVSVLIVHTALFSSMSFAFDLGLSPLEKYGLNIKSYGAFDVNNADYCSQTAKVKWVGNGFYPGNYLLNIDRFSKKNIYVQDKVWEIERIIVDVMNALQTAGDTYVVGHHVCLGLYDYGNQPNAISHPQGYLAFDPQLLFSLSHSNSGFDATSTLVLHEFAHQVEFWHNYAFKNDANSRRKELAADCVGSALGTMSFLHKARAKAPTPAVVDFAFSITMASIRFLGDSSFEESDHHGTLIERLKAAEAGKDLVKVHYYLSGQSLKGLNITNVLDRCVNYITARDQRYGDNWPNVH